MNNYQQMQSASRTYNQILEKKYRKKERSKIWRKRIATMALITGLAVTANISYETLKAHHEKVNIMQDATQELVEVGYPPVPDADGNWHENYHLLQEVDLIKIYALMGKDATEEVLKTKGYENWDYFLAQEGYENRQEWREKALEEYRMAEKTR